MPNGIYLFGGRPSRFTSEFLRNGSNTWEAGPNIPFNMKHSPIWSIHDMVRDIYFESPSWNLGIHNNVNGGHRISEDSFIIVRVRDILKFSFKTNEWSYIYKLKEGRVKGCSAILDGKLVVTGGYDINSEKVLKTTEVMDLSNGKSWLGGDLNIARYAFGMDLSDFDGKIRILAFGGVTDYAKRYRTLNSVEVWYDDLQCWKMTSLQLFRCKRSFGYLNVPLGIFKTLPYFHKDTQRN